MSKVFVHLGMSLDGFIAGENRGPKNPLGDGGPSIHSWLFQQRAFLQVQSLGDGGETGADNRVVEQLLGRIGANILGKRMFEEGEAHWPEEAPFHKPVFVLTHEMRKPWVRKGGTTFYFVNDGIHSALKQARQAAGTQDVRICGGRDVVQQYLEAGLVEELALSVAPVLLGSGLRLFDGINVNALSLEIAQAQHSPLVTHLTYRVRR